VNRRSHYKGDSQERLPGVQKPDGRGVPREGTGVGADRGARSGEKTPSFPEARRGARSAKTGNEGRFEPKTNKRYSSEVFKKPLTPVRAAAPVNERGRILGWGISDPVKGEIRGKKRENHQELLVVKIVRMCWWWTMNVRGRY